VLGLRACGSSNGSAQPAAAGTSSMAMATTPPATTAEATADSDATPTGPHNFADIDFASGMIPHHAQAIEMARIVFKRTDNAEIKELATKIKAAQTPEITTLSGWLTAWGAPVPDPSSMDAMSMAGMIRPADLKKLKSAPKAKAETLFLTQMSEHHAGAIAMAKTELTSGSNPQAKALARSIKTAQAAEIAQIRAMLKTVG
jgi:uncharacterized protein (DUF305 family)